MKNLFLVFTPYHVRISNLITKKLNDEKNGIIVFQRSYLKDYIQKANYIFSDNLFCDELCEVSIKRILTKRILREKFNNEIKKMDKIIGNFNPDRIFVYSDNPIYFQKIFLNTKAKIIFVEEGAAIYNHYNLETYSLKEKISFYLHKNIAYKCNEAKLFLHGNGGYEDYLILREPDLVESNSKKIKLTHEFFKEAFSKHEVLDLNLDEGYLYCPAGTLYDKEKMIKVTKRIFKKFYDEEIKLYVKLHPRERYVAEIKSLIKDYCKVVNIIEDETITSEDIILQDKIIGIISDFSSMIMNVTYIRDELEVYTTLDMIEEEYGVDFMIDITIFDFLRKKGKIKDFREFGRINSKSYL